MPNTRIHTIHSWGVGRTLTDEQYREQLAVRFWAKVDKSPGQGPKGDCWEWRGSRDPAGYGRIGFHRPGVGHRPIGAARAYYYLIHGQLPSKGVECCHECDHPPCVRPEHIWQGTHKQNMNDAQAKGRMPSATPDLRERLLRVKLTRRQCSLIKKAHKKQKASIFQLSDLIGVDFSYISLIENGQRRTLRVEQVHKLMQFLKIDEDAFDLQRGQLYRFGLTVKPKPRPQHVTVPRAEGYDTSVLERALNDNSINIDYRMKSGPVHYLTVKKILRGERVKLSTLLKVAGWLGVSESELFNRQQRAA